VKDAVAVSGLAVAQITGGNGLPVRISGIAKLPYLTVEEPVVDFGNVTVGVASERIIRIQNHSPVIANYSIVQATAGGVSDGVFVLGPTSGAIPAHESAELRLVFTPTSTHMYSCEDFYVGTVGGNKLTLNVRGTAAPPALVFSGNSFNYGYVAAGTPATKVLYMQNLSAVPVHYEFQLDPRDAFAMSAARGTIPAHITGHVVITFNAPVAANFWRRVVCIVKDADPMAVDLLATSYDDKSRPPLLQAEHVDRYYRRIAGGGPPVTFEFIVGSLDRMACARSAPSSSNVTGGPPPAMRL